MSIHLHLRTALIALTLSATATVGEPACADVFLIVGGGIMSFSRPGDTKSNLQGAYRAGGGLDYFVTRNWVAQAVVTFVGGAARDNINYTTVKAGVSYVFR